MTCSAAARWSSVAAPTISTTAAAAIAGALLQLSMAGLSIAAPLYDNLPGFGGDSQDIFFQAVRNENERKEPDADEVYDENLMTAELREYIDSMLDGKLKPDQYQVCGDSQNDTGRSAHQWERFCMIMGAIPSNLSSYSVQAGVRMVDWCHDKLKRVHCDYMDVSLFSLEFSGPVEAARRRPRWQIIPLAVLGLLVLFDYTIAPRLRMARVVFWLRRDSGPW